MEQEMQQAVRGAVEASKRVLREELEAAYQRFLRDPRRVSVDLDAETAARREWQERRMEAQRRFQNRLEAARVLREGE